MMDDDICYVSPSTTYRVLKNAGVLRPKIKRTVTKGSGFEQPQGIHVHWHTDISMISIKQIVYYMIFVLDGYSRKILSWGLFTDMKQDKAQIVLQKAREAYPNATNTRLITDNGKQFSAKEFKSFLAFSGLTHVTTSPYYPQSNGKLERYHSTIKDFLYKKVLLDEEDAKNTIQAFVNYYNFERLHSAIGYITPETKFLNKEHQVFKNRDNKLKNARLLRCKNFCDTISIN